MAGATPVQHSPYCLFQDQETQGRSHSGRPHLTDDPSIINFHYALKTCFLGDQEANMGKLKLRETSKFMLLVWSSSPII